MKSYTDDELIALRDRYEQWLMAQRGVIGTGVGVGAGGNLVLRIFTSGVTTQTRRVITQKLPDIPIAWEEGEVIAD